MINFRKYILWAVSLLAVILLFAGIDYILHTIRVEWAVPDYYFHNKIIYGFLWSIPALGLALLFHKVWQRAFIFSFVISIILQIRYYFEGYPLDFVLIFLFIHFAILFVLSLIMFKLNKYI